MSMNLEALYPILKIIKPLAKKHINEENMSSVFDALTRNVPVEDGEKPVLLVSRRSDGSVVGSVATIDAGHLITGVYAQEPLAELILQLLGDK